MRNLLIAVIAATVMSGCLKSKVLYEYSGIDPVILNPKTNFPSTQAFPAPLIDSVFGVQKLNFYIRYSFRIAPERTVRVTVSRNDELLDAYNTKFNTHYKLLPADACVFNKVVEIPSGTQEVILPITLVPSKLNVADNYLVGFTITDGDGFTIAENSKSMVYTVKGH